MDSCYSSQFAVKAMELQKAIQLYVGDAVPIGCHEGLVAEVFANALDTAAGVGQLPGFGQRDAPSAFGMFIENLDALLTESHGKVAIMHFVVEKVVAD